MSYADGKAPAKIAVLGAGSWGTTFAKILGDAAESAPQRRIVLWGRRQEVVDQINQHPSSKKNSPAFEQGVCAKKDQCQSEHRGAW